MLEWGMFNPVTLLGLLPLFLCAGGVPFLLSRRVRGWLSRGLRLYGLVWIGASILLAALCLINLANPRLFGFSNGIGAVATLATVPALGLWPAHALTTLLKRHRFAVTALPRQMFVFTYRHHRFLGWLVFATATGHGVYFLLAVPLRAPRMATGLLAWAVLAAGVALGLGFDWLPKRQPVRRDLRIWHVIAALLLLAALLVHV
jgi:hypothetical protein